MPGGWEVVRFWGGAPLVHAPVGGFWPTSRARPDRRSLPDLTVVAGLAEPSLAQHSPSPTHMRTPAHDPQAHGVWRMRSLQLCPRASQAAVPSAAVSGTADQRE